MSLKIFCSYFLTELLMIFVVIYYYHKISNITIKFNIKNVLFIILLDLSLIMNNYYNYIALRFICSIIIVALIIRYFYKPTLKDNIYYTITYSIICIIIELLATIFIPLSVSNIEILNNTLELKIGLSIGYSLLMILLFSSFYFIKFIRKIREIFQIKYIVVSIICILNILIIYRCYILNNMCILFLSILCCLFMIITIRVIINDKYNIKILLTKNNNLKNSYKAYSETIEECREFKHNIKNELYSLKTILPKSEQEKINSIIKKYNTNYEWISKIDDIPEGLQGIIYLKKKEAESRNIKVLINTEKNININNYDFFNLSEIIGILLDNAIDASKLLKNRIIDINIKEEKSQLNISIKNRFKNNIDINKIGKKNYSTKEYKSGIGLNYINKIKNSKINLRFNVVDDIFITNIKYTTK